MSRCKACDMPLYGAFTPHLNKDTHEEDDLCSACNALSKQDYIEPEYTCGNNPRDGVTAPVDSGYE